MEQEIKDKYPLAIDTINFPVVYYYNGQSIIDNLGNLILDIRGWRRIQYLTEPEKRQDQIGEMIAELINSTLSNKYNKHHDTQAK